MGQVYGRRPAQGSVRARRSARIASPTPLAACSSCWSRRRREAGDLPWRSVAG